MQYRLNSELFYPFSTDNNLNKMHDSDSIHSIKHLQYALSRFNQEKSPCDGIKNVSIIVNKKRLKQRKKHKELKYQPSVAFCLPNSLMTKQVRAARHSSMPEINKRSKPVQAPTRSVHTIEKQSKIPFQSKFIVNVVSEHRFDKCLNPYYYPKQTKWKVYRCQLNTNEESCCCSCNSDAMFEVMKSLYDCYKKKNCDNCECILCGHLQKEEKLLGEMKKSIPSIGIDTASTKERKEKIKKAEKAIAGKTPAEKEKILRELAKTRQPLPEGKTPSEKALITKIRNDLGLPPEPKTTADKEKMRKAEAAGIITPLEGKTPEQKEKILKAQAALGIPLPEGRTPSEKALIQKVKAAAGIPMGIPSEKLRKARAAGLITPLEGKTPAQKEKILKGLAMHGIPLPEGKTPSEKKLIDKVRADLGLPPEPKTKALKDKYANAANAGFLQPLEGKSPKEKEKILQGLANLGIPLPEGRTASEKALIAKVKAKTGPPLEDFTPSEKVRKAKAAGLLTPLKDKKPEEKEKILRGLAMAGIPLPEGQTPSEKKLIGKVRTDLGLPIEPPSKGIRDKHEQAAKLGLLQPLEGKTPQQKERILQGLHDMGVPLPIGRTPSEKSLIAKIKAGSRAPSVALSPSEKMRRAKAAGLLTPLKGKTPVQKEKILNGLAKHGLPLPEGQTPSEKKLIDKVRADLGLPPEPETPEMRAKYAKAADAGLLQPLEGKTPAQKEKILQGLHDMGIPLPEGRTASEKSLIAKVKARPRAPSVALAPSEKMRRAKAEGLITPLKGKTPAQKEKILNGLAKHGLPLPEGQTPSEKKLIGKVRADLGLPPEPKTPEMRDKYAKAADAGLMQPLEGKTPAQKEKILQGLHDMGIPLPEGRTPSEKSLIAKVKARPRAPSVALKPSERMRRAKAEGLITPLKGKTPAQKEKILNGLAKHGLPLPEGQTPSEKKLIDKVRADLGLPPEPKTPEMRDKYAKAADAGFMQPLEGKTPAQKEKILQGLQDMGIPLPEGRTPSEKSLIAKIKSKPREPSVALKPSERMRRAKAEGLITPLKGKTPAQKEKILNGLAKHGLPLPEGQTPSEKKLIDKVRADLGLPPEPKTPEMRDKYAKAADAGFMQPLEGKTPAQKEKILQGLQDMGIPLPEGRTPSEKSLIAKIKAKPREPSVALKPSERMRRAKAEGLITPLKGKTPVQKEKILNGLAKHGLPLPEGQTPSEKKLIDKVRANLGLPPEPKTPEMRDKYAQAADAGLLQPLEGKTPAQKEKILQGLHDMGIPLPEGRTPSEKSLIAKVKARPRPPSVKGTHSDRMRKAKADGLLTPLKGKTPDQREKILRGLAMAGIPLPEGQTPSEKSIINKVRNDLGLPIEPPSKAIRDKHNEAAKAGLLLPLEGKTPAQKEKILQGQHDMGIPLPVGRTPSEKSLIAKIKARARPPSVKGTHSDRMRKAKADGLLTSLKGKTPDQREKILRGLAMVGIPLPEGQTPSEKSIINKVRNDLGLPIEPPSKAVRDKHNEAAKAGLLFPLEGKTPEMKEKILQGLYDMGIPLPVGRTPSEKSLIAKIKARPRPPSVKGTHSDRMRKAKADGLLTPLKGKTPDQREKILRGLAMAGIPLPEGQTPSEKSIINKVRNDLGLPIEPPSKAVRDKHNEAAKAGLLFPLEGKTPALKEKILQGQHDMGIPLPVGRTPSEKSLIAKIMAGSRALSVALAPSEKMRRAKAEGLLTPLKGKTPAQKEKILNGLAKHGLPLPEGQTPSEKKLIDKVRADLGLPPEPKTPEMRDKYAKAADAGFLQPLEGKTPAQKEKILQGLHDMGIPLPEGRTASEKSLIAKVKARPRAPSAKLGPSERLKAAKAAGFLTPLKGKSPEQKEKILKGLAKLGLPLPEGKTASEKKLIDKVRAEIGLPPEPKTPSIKEKYAKAQAAGLITPLEGKSPAQKEKILRAQAAMGLPLPEGRTPSEKALIAALKKEPQPSITTEKLRKAKAAGLFTPLAGKDPARKEKILKGLAKAGLPLPEGKTPSEKALINKVKQEFGIPDRTPSEKLKRAKAAGLLTPLEGKTPAQKEKILRGRAAAGLPLPVGKSPSERALIQKIKDDTGYVTPSPSERLRKAKAAGLLTPLKGKSPAEKEKIIKDMIAAGVPIPEGETPSEKSLIRKIIAEPLPAKKTRSDKLREAKTAGLLTPLQGKTPEQKKKILKGLVKAGLPLPEAKTPSEKDLIDKVREEAGLPPEPGTPSLREKYDKALASGIITPLEGKTPAEKENILKRLHDAGIPLPEGRTPSEKSMIKRLKELPKPSRILSEKMRKAKAAGLLTPLQGKSPEQKEKIMRGLAEQGLPLPEAKTASEKKLAAKIRKELGLPPAPKTPSMKERHDKAAAAGVLVPLEGLTPAEKEKVLRAQADLGLPLPEGRTASEKSLIAKIKAERAPSKMSSARLRKAKAAGLMTPLEGKTPAEKEKIIRGLAEAGLPLPEGKTPSEKSLIHKVRTELGIPPPATTASEKSVVRKAKAEGLFTPITGKPPAEKERILRGLAEAGLPLPVGKTQSEKDLIKKVRAEVGLPPEPTPSEKMGKIKKKSKKVGAEKSKKSAKAVGAKGAYADVIKAETCDRGCGCDKKKIRFKHSYVKIRVTSPDISALCPCPDECIPGVKAGAFIDNEGIKVTVGRVIGVPSYPKKFSNPLMLNNIMSNLDHCVKPNSLENCLNESIYKFYGSETGVSNKFDNSLNTSSSNISNSTRPRSTESENIYLQSSTPPYEGRSSKSDRIVEISRRLQSSGDIYRGPKTKSTVSSFDSILVIKSETSLSLNTSSSGSIDILSEMSVTNSSDLSYSTHYSGYQLSEDLLSVSSLEGSKKSSSYETFDKPTLTREHKNKRKMGAIFPQDEYLIFRMCVTRQNNNIVNKLQKSHLPENYEPDVPINQLASKLDIKKILDKILRRKQFSGASSIFIVVPTSEDDEVDESSDGFDSSLKSSETYTNVKTAYTVDPGLTLRKSSTERKVCGKGKKFYMQEILSFHDKTTMFDNESKSVKVFRHDEIKGHKICQFTATSTEERSHVVGTDTTDRPCCCCQKKSASTVINQNCNSKDQYVATALSSQFTSLFLKGQKSGFLSSDISMLPQVQVQVSCLSYKRSRSLTPAGCGPNICRNTESLNHHCDDYPQTNSGYDYQEWITDSEPMDCYCPEAMRPVKVGRSVEIQSFGSYPGGQEVPFTGTENNSYLSGVECACNDLETQNGTCCPCKIKSAKLGVATEKSSRSLTKKTRFRIANKVTVEASPSISDQSSCRKKAKGTPKILIKKGDCVCEQNPGIIKDQKHSRSPSCQKPKPTKFDCKSKEEKLAVAKEPEESHCVCEEVNPTPPKEKVASGGSSKKLKTKKDKVDCQCKEKKPDAGTDQMASGSSCSQKPVPTDKVLPLKAEPPGGTEAPRFYTQLGTKMNKLISDISKACITDVICACNSEAPQGNKAVDQPYQPQDKKKSHKPSKEKTGKETKKKTVSRTTSDPVSQPASPEQTPQTFQEVPQPELMVPPEQMFIPELEEYKGPIPYEGIGPSCGWIDTEEIMKIRSALTLTTSGFKVVQKKKRIKPKEDGAQMGIELDFEDAIRYYASMNPERFRDLMQEKPHFKFEEPEKEEKEANTEKNDDKKDKKSRKDKKKKRKSKNENIDKNVGTDDRPEVTHSNDEVSCSCPYGPIPPPISYSSTESSEEDSWKGFKLSIDAKGFASLGHAKCQ